ncbi:MAG TPA: hypothetical protein V6D08_03945 [Candidatus Obscuribacterales bacterium]
MTNEGEKDVEKQEKIEPKDARLPGDDDAIQSTRKAAELETERLEKLRVEREKLGHLSIFSLGSGAVLEIVDSGGEAARKVFGFDVVGGAEIGSAADEFKPGAVPGKVIHDEYGRLGRVTYPSGFSVEVTYESPGPKAEPESISLSNGTTVAKLPDGSWGQLIDGSGQLLSRYTTVEISADGALNFGAEDHVLRWMPVGAMLVTDRYGRLGKVTYPSGFSAEVRYAEAGKGTKADAIRFSDDTTLQRNSDGTWSKTADRSGTVVEQYESVDVFDDGTIKFESKEYTLTWHCQGCAIVTDQYGRLIKAMYASGLSAQVIYEGKGAEPSKIKLSNDTVLERGADGSWSQRAASSGEVLTRYRNVQVAHDGTISMEAENYRVDWLPDGTTVAADLSTGQMTRLHADGTRERLVAAIPKPPSGGP